MSHQTHRSSPQVLGRRTLERDHRSLPAYLLTGAAALDVGCGVGAITAGIARRVGPAGLVVGVDRDESLIAMARAEHGDLQNLSFEIADAADLPYHGRFDVVTAARTLQWISDPQRAVRSMCGALRPGGVLVVLDYNHRDNSWSPAAPAEFSLFYQAFLDWRAANGWDNAMAARLPGLLQAAGMGNIENHVDDEVTRREEPEFGAAAGIWSHVIDDAGPRIVAAGFLSEAERLAAAERYRNFVEDQLETQTLVLRTVVGIRQ
jgi:SAM-dependent methyltransferase